jgi:hypothetical protein
MYIIAQPNCRVLARIKSKRPKKHVVTKMTHRLREIFFVKCQKQSFSFNKREAKVYCYAFLHVLKRNTCIKHEEKIFFLVSCVPAQYAKINQSIINDLRCPYPLIVIKDTIRVPMFSGSS